MRISDWSSDVCSSDLPGRVIAIVERHVYGADGRIPLLPKGTRIVCHYESLAKQGDSRLAGNSNRAIRPDGASIMLSDAAAADQVARTDRKSGGQGKSVSVRVDPVSRGIITK